MIYYIMHQQKIIDNINKIDDKYNYAMLFSHNPELAKQYIH